MRTKSWLLVGSMAFSVWRGWRKAKRTVRHNAKAGLKRVQKAI